MERWVALLPTGLVGLVFMALAVPLAMRRVAPNPWYGFRVARTMRSRDIWYESNAYGGRLMFWLGALLVAAAAGLSVVPDQSPERLLNAGVLAMTAGAVVMMALWYRHLLTLEEPAADGTRDVFGAPAGMPDLPLEMPPLKLLSLPFVLTGILMMAISIPLVLGDVPPNGSYGFRTAETLRSAQVWYEANAYSGWTMISAGAVIVAASVGLALSRRVPDRAYVPIMVVVLLVSLGASLALSFRYLATIT